MKHLIGIFVLAMMGCTPTPHDRYTVYVDAGISADHQLIALQALQDWHDRVGVVFDTRITSDTCSGDSCIQIWEAGRGDLGQSKDLEDCTAAGTMGCTASCIFDDNNARHIRVLQDMGKLEPLRPMVIKHELAHALGLQHMNGQVLMSPVYDHKRGDGSMTITEADVEQYWEVRH